MTKITRHDFDVPNLGPAEFSSPLQRLRYEADAEFITDDYHRVLFDYSLEKVRDALENGSEPATIERAGPRERIFHNPAQTICAVVTCGGLCPGLNDVIRGLVLTLNYSYGVRTIYGIPFGYEGFIPKYSHTPMHLTPELVTKLHAVRAGRNRRRRWSIFLSSTASMSSSSSAATAHCAARRTS
jgi:6-phosphofructokinase 1